MWKSKAKNLAFLKLSDSIKYNIIYENKGNQEILYRSLRRVVKPRLHYEAISCCAYAFHPGNHYRIARKTPRRQRNFYDPPRKSNSSRTRRKRAINCRWQTWKHSGKYLVRACSRVASQRDRYLSGFDTTQIFARHEMHWCRSITETRYSFANYNDRRDNFITMHGKSTNR